jgi:CBS domain containing-hemolysin-like protein
MTPLQRKPGRTWLASSKITTSKKPGSSGRVSETLNGLIIEHLETIPPSGTALTIAEYPIEILDATEHAIKKVRIRTPDSSARLRAAT